jgi:hypothetical protein
MHQKGVVHTCGRLGRFGLIGLIGLLGLVACSSGGGGGGGEDAPPPGGEMLGEITVSEGGSPGGEGVSIADALAEDTTDPQLVNGILLQDADSVLWLCTSLLESSPPGCGEPKLRVSNFPREDGTLDPANADETGLQQDGDVVWIEDYQLFGVAEPGL